MVLIRVKGHSTCLDQNDQQAVKPVTPENHSVRERTNRDAEDLFRTYRVADKVGSIPGTTYQNKNFNSFR